MNTLTQEEYDRRMKMYNDGMSYKEIAYELGLTYEGVCSWFDNRGLRSNKLNINNGEYERRLKAYHKHNTDVAAAKEVGLTAKAFGGWRRYAGLPSKFKQSQIKHKPRKADNSYVKDRPQWERSVMRSFGSIIERANPKADVWEIMECYRDCYGCSVTNS